MLSTSRTLLIAGALIGVLSSGCGDKGSGDGKKAAATAAGGAKTAAPGGGPAGTVDPQCTAFVDHTDDNATRTIAWDAKVGTNPERCIKVKAGQNVTFEGDFAKNPMVAAKGDAPTPIAKALEGLSNPGEVGQERTVIELAKPGTYGFISAKDPTMKGAIQVVP